MADNFPRLKSTLKDRPFLILAAIIARIVKDILLSSYDFTFNPLIDEFDLVKLVVNWGLLGFFFFGILFVRNLIWKKKK